MDMAHDRRELQNMSQKEESFEKYAQCWRELTAQVEPPLAEIELVGMFMDTLKYARKIDMFNGSSLFCHL